eukprot:14524782-Alexandrium_andersonii.AAC.1
MAPSPASQGPSWPLSFSSCAKAAREISCQLHVPSLSKAASLIAKYGTFSLQAGSLRAAS